MCSTKVITIIILIFLFFSHSKKIEGFTQKEIKKKAKEIYNNKKLFYPGAKYSGIKYNMPWIDPIIYNDIYKLSLKEQLTINNLESTLYNGIK
jgi:hypothetical protein